jgi:hypothetical protein
MQDAPDLLLVLRDFGFVSIKNKAPVVVQRKEVAGTHHPEGVFFAYGPGIKQGEMLDTLNITDVAATLLYSLGLEIPPDLEGKVPKPVFTEQHLAENPVVIGGGTTFKARTDEQDRISEDEKEKIMTQLRMLGYME